MAEHEDDRVTRADLAEMEARITRRMTQGTIHAVMASAVISATMVIVLAVLIS